MSDQQPMLDGQQPYPEQSQATTSLVLGIIGVAGCWILAPFAWFIGNKELKAIEAGRRAPQGQGNAKAGKILGIVGTCLLALAIPAGLIAVFLTAAERDEEGEVVDGGTISVFDLQVGDCGNLPEEADQYETIEVVPCDQPHDFETYAAIDFTEPDGSDFPGEQEVSEFADTQCYAEFETFVGVPWEDSPDLTYTTLYPTERSWNSGDREILCMLVHAETGTQLQGSMEGTG